MGDRGGMCAILHRSIKMFGVQFILQAGDWQMMSQDRGKQSLKPGQLNGEQQRNLVNFLLVLQHSRYLQMQRVWFPCLKRQAEKFHLVLKGKSLECSIWISQALAYEACNHMCMPLHRPKTSDMLKKACLVWLKKLQGVQQITGLKQKHFFHFLYNTKILRENHVYLFVVRLVQWWKLYYIYIFFTQRTTDFHRLKRNMNDETIIFLTSLLIPLTWNILFFFSQKQLPGSVL